MKNKRRDEEDSNRTTTCHQKKKQRIIVEFQEISNETKQLENWFSMLEK